MSIDLSAFTPPPADDAEINHPDMVRKELIALIEDAMNAHPRSLQKRLGPSEIGTPCTRKLAHKLADTQPVNTGVDKWRATVGVSVHAWLASMLERANTMLGDRFLVEHRVRPGQLAGDVFDGSCDAYDTWTQLVVDWKCVGANTLKTVKSKGPSATYRTQVQTYGYGWQRRGHAVRNVAIMFLPAAGDLAQAQWFAYPYRPEVAVEAMRRADAIHALVEQAGNGIIGTLPTADDHCPYCAFYQPGATDLSKACPGDPSIHRPPPPPPLTMTK